MSNDINNIQWIRLFATIILFFFTCAGYAQNSNTILLVPSPTGSEADNKYTDSSIFFINAAGAVSYYNSNASDDWTVTGTTVTATGALNKTFTITFGGMHSVKTTEGNNFGEMISAAGIDRASNGALGIRGGISNGIDPNEGFYFGLDLTNLSSTAAIQITKIGVTDLSAINETGMVVSRMNPLKRLVFGNAGFPGVNYQLSGGAGIIDVSAFNLYLTGGQVNNAMLSVFNNGAAASGFRITQIELKVLTNIFNPQQVTNIAHPRLLLKQGQQVAIQTLIAQSADFNAVHSYILEQADTFLIAPALVYNATNGRMLETARVAIKQIFYLSYAYRMTNQSSYLTRAEQVMNTVCDFPDWVTYTLDVAEMCFGVSIGYDWLYNGLSATTRQKAREKILNYAFLTQKTKPFWDYTSNWNQVGIGGLAFGALAILGDGTAQMDQEAKYILNNILVKNPNSMETYANGNYQEGAMYWSYGTTYEVLMLSALEEIFGQSHEGVKRLTYTPGFLESARYMQFITGTSSLYFNYSDCTEKRTPLPAALWMAKKLNNTDVLSLEKELLQNGKYASNYSEDSRFLPIALIYGKDVNMGNLQPPQQKLWNGYGEQPVVLVRTDWQGANGKYMGVKGGTPNYSHAHMDGGSFAYDSQGLRWAVDFGKEDYDAINAGISPAGALNDFSQSSARWNIFKVSNLNHNTISIKKASESNWQHHKTSGSAAVTEIYDSNAKRGAKLDLKPLIGLNNELDAAQRSIYMVDEAYLEVKDYIDNGAQAINLYWNMATTAVVDSLSASKLKLTQGGRTTVLEIVSSNPAVTFILKKARSTDPVTYYPAATYERKNPGTVMIGFEAAIPANEVVTFTITLKDGAEVPPSAVMPVNYVLLELPAPNTGLEGNTLYSDASEFHVNGAGKVSIGGIASEYAWNVYGDTNVDSILNKNFFFKWQGMNSTNTTAGINYGNLLTQAGIDRSENGELGVRGGASNGIDINEGFRFGFDATRLPDNVSLQLVKVGVNFVSGSRSGMLVNRNDTNKQKSFGGSATSSTIVLPTGSGFVDVEDLNMVVEGGETDYDLASLFNTGGSGSFRINKLVFKILSDGASPLMAQPLMQVQPQQLPEKDKKNISIYPNPFTKNITLKSVGRAFEDIRVRLYTSWGTPVLNHSYHLLSDQEEIKLDLQQLKSGIYLIQVLNNTGTIITKRIIKE
ncbi:T9SS type A sorting domain-containing protein [Pedobacter heparinus]|uniref:Uncharacterized protein n=1 Tax=Pedobacter heparinus (strain ATCC 13125 / DSM 2366 / CIP 104194 / JCM 7457 / NBRC 12017 / NCIMB 9290 / NRRL B-14731 / HIM 762-3) TaxID=485917 RepID=C6Y0D9_PEDHD|nr:T9SS type A sorting domain-containing protein [Pedobacter heparinus]ACU04851.1 hypothetical protein Phep_2650 [Pedobacter heparinus DSM 2366]